MQIDILFNGVDLIVLSWSLQNTNDKILTIFLSKEILESGPTDAVVLLEFLKKDLRLFHTLQMAALRAVK